MTRLDTLGRPITRWPTTPERFAQRITEVPAPAGFDTPCWQWDAIRSDGYGIVKDGGRAHRAHRWSYEYHVAEVPDGLVIDHLCRNRGCVNPLHLEPVTVAENTRRGIGAQRASEWRTGLTHCKRGHEFTPENTYMWRGRRHCRACNRLRDKKSRSRRAVSQ